MLHGRAGDAAQAAASTIPRVPGHASPNLALLRRRLWRSWPTTSLDKNAGASLVKSDGRGPADHRKVTSATVIRTMPVSLYSCGKPLGFISIS